MVRRLTRVGDSLALVFDSDLLGRTGISHDTVLEVSTDGDVIIVTPKRSEARTEKLGEAMARADERYGGVFRRLAK
jgi:antitoxin component of MazEF toxin-antitoxin module